MSKEKETEEHRNFVTVALTQLTGDMERVKTIVEKNEKWLAKLMVELEITKLLSQE